jgi:hypothetical protein
MKRLGCFYLSESLDEDMDYIFRVPEAYQREGVNDFDHSPVETVLFSDGKFSVSIFMGGIFSIICVIVSFLQGLACW